MASEIQDRVYETFVAIATGQAAIPETAINGGDEVAKPLKDAAETMERAGALWENLAPAASSAGKSAGATAAQSVAAGALGSVFGAVSWTGGLTGSGILGNVVGSITGGGDGGSSGGGSVLGTIASTVLRSGLGLVPLIGGLFGLFGGGDDSEPPALEKYVPPASLAFRAAATEWGLSESDYDQMGMARAYRTGAGAPEAAASGNASGSEGLPAPQITVNIQAMDARSFLDRSGDIAAAVRDAMLNLNSINDVVSDL